jgi:hypothetical protein
MGCSDPVIVYLSFPKKHPPDASQDRNGDNGARSLEFSMQRRVFP